MYKYNKKDILWFNEINKSDIKIVGGKSASLGELSSNKAPVPYGFATTTNAYQYFMEKSGALKKLNAMLKELSNNDIENSKALHTIADKIRKIILNSKIPDVLIQEFSDAYHKLSSKIGEKEAYVAIRSSATSEDLPDASFAGQQETYLNVVGVNNVIEKIKYCYASLFTDRAIYYRATKGFSQKDLSLSAAVQIMISSKASGTIFTINATNGDPSQIMIEGIWGLGEYNAQGIVTPDNWIVDKKTMKIVSNIISSKKIMLVQKKNGGVEEKKVDEANIDRPVLTNEQVIELAKYGERIENHYGCYMDIEWTLDSHNKIWILQARPETVWSQRGKKIMKNDSNFNDKNIDLSNKIIVKGLPASPGAAYGRVHIIYSPENISDFKKGEILVTDMTSPDWGPAMQKAAAIITNSGGLTCHAAIVSREMQIPCLVGTKSLGISASDVLKDGQLITVDSKNGVVYNGKVDSILNESSDNKKYNDSSYASQNAFIPTGTPIMMNLGNPSLAEKYSSLPADGIGLMREEFIWTNYIHEHPLSLIANNKSEQAINMLAEGISKVTRAFAPRPVVLRFSDFKSGEYRHLIGGNDCEPYEPSDLLGWRGASRYYDPKYIEAFKLELSAVKKVRNNFGLKNLNVMIPFVRTVDEIRKITKIMNDEGIRRSDDFKVYMMAEIPSNIILADQFNNFVDGYSIGSNDLTMLILGCDRNNDAVAHLFDERNLAVRKAICHLIKTAHKDGKTVSICGQAPSEYPEYTKFLIENGIDYVSVNPDMVEKTRRNVAMFEQKIILDKATGKGLKTNDYDW